MFKTNINNAFYWFENFISPITKIKNANKWHKFKIFLEWIIHMHVIIYDKGLIKAAAVDKCAVQWILVSKGKVKGSRWCLDLYINKIVFKKDNFKHINIWLNR